MFNVVKNKLCESFASLRFGSKGVVHTVNRGDAEDAESTQSKTNDVDETVSDPIVD